MTITELRNKKLIPIIISDVEEHRIRHWWKIKDRRINSEKLYYNCEFPLSSKPFESFEDCLANLNKIIFNLKPIDLNKQFDQIIEDDNN